MSGPGSTQSAQSAGKRGRKHSCRSFAPSYCEGPFQRTTSPVPGKPLSALWLANESSTSCDSLCPVPTSSLTSRSFPSKNNPFDSPPSTNLTALEKMDAHTLELLEFPKIRELVAGYAGSSLGKDLARQAEPGSDGTAIRAELAL